MVSNYLIELLRRNAEGEGGLVRNIQGPGGGNYRPGPDGEGWIVRNRQGQVGPDEVRGMGLGGVAGSEAGRARDNALMETLSAGMGDGARAAEAAASPSTGGPVGAGVGSAAMDLKDRTGGMSGAEMTDRDELVAREANNKAGVAPQAYAQPAMDLSGSVGGMAGSEMADREAAARTGMAEMIGREAAARAGAPSAPAGGAFVGANAQALKDRLSFINRLNLEWARRAQEGN